MYTDYIISQKSSTLFVPFIINFFIIYKSKPEKHIGNKKKSTTIATLKCLILVVIKIRISDDNT